MKSFHYAKSFQLFIALSKYPKNNNSYIMSFTTAIVRIKIICIHYDFFQEIHNQDIRKSKPGAKSKYLK